MPLKKYSLNSSSLALLCVKLKSAFLFCKAHAKIFEKMKWGIKIIAIFWKVYE